MKLPKILNVHETLRVVLDYIPQVQTINLGLYAAVGSRLETDHNSGISHFLEHMVFKGTTNRNTQQITEEVESRGGYINAWTSKVQTAWYCKLLAEDYGLGVDILFDLVNHNTFPEEEIVKEKKVVIEEIRQSKDDHDDLLYEYFSSLTFKNTSLGRSILGTEETVLNITQQDLKNYLQQYYFNQNMVFVASGNFNEDKLIEEINTFAKSDKTQNSIDYPVAQYHNAKDILFKDGLSQDHLIVSYPAVCLYDEEYYTYVILAIILGRGMSSRLFQEVREKQSLAYSIYSSVMAYKDLGYLYIHVSCSPDNTNKAVSTIQSEIKSLLTTKPIAEKEIKKAKRQLKSSIYMSLENTTSRAERWANNLLVHNKLISNSEISAKIEKVSLDLLNNIVRKIVQSDPNIIMVSSQNKSKYQL